MPEIRAPYARLADGAVLPEQPVGASRACRTCAFSAPPENAPVGAPLECRRRPPVVDIVRLKTGGMPAGLDISGFAPPDEVLQALTNFPSVQPDQWCGEYEAQPHAVDD